MSIDPREYGVLEANVKNINDTLRKQVEAIDKLSERLREVEDTLAEAKGGWKVIMWIAGASGAVGALGALLIKNWLGR